MTWAERIWFMLLGGIIIYMTMAYGQIEAYAERADKIRVEVNR